MADFYKNTPLPIYNAIFYNRFECYHSITQMQDYITTADNQYYNLASVIDININKMNSYSTLYFINTLNNINSLVEKLNNLQNIINEERITDRISINNFLQKVENSLKNIDNIFSNILIFEIRSKLFEQLDEVNTLIYELQDVHRNKSKYQQYANDYINILNEHITENKNCKRTILSILKQTIVLLENVKGYVDIYYELENTNKYSHLSSDSVKFFSHSMFNFCIPKHYIRLCIMKDNKLTETMSRFLPSY